MKQRVLLAKSIANVPDFEDFGLGCFLLAGSEVYKLK
jgi:hypothetical protein